MDAKTKKFIERAKEVHGNKYDYRKTVYTKAKDKVTVTCHKKDKFGYEHGDFELRACNHLLGTGCPKCGNRFAYTIDEWIRNANIVHSNKYDYSLITETKGRSKGKIICPIHGIFEQELASHLSGCGCPKCNKGVVDTRDGFIESANKIHRNYYNYDKVVYVNRKVPVIITCPRHGDFEQTPDAHLRGCGCKKCKSSILENIVLKMLNNSGIQYIFQYQFGDKSIYKADFFIPETGTIIECQGEQHFYPTKFSSKTSDETAVKQLNDRINADIDKYETALKYGYQVIYFTIPNYFHNNINIGDFKFYDDKIMFTDIDALANYIAKHNHAKNTSDNFIRFCEDFKMRISDDIIFVDNTTFKCKNFVIAFHRLLPNKKDTLNSMTRDFKKRKYFTIHIFEDEYVQHKPIVLSKLSHILGFDTKNKKKIYARKCTISEIGMDEAKSFLDINHIQGFVPSSVYLGAFYDDEIIGVMTFLEESENKWILNRFASDNNSICCGVGGKMFKYFVTKYSPLTVKSFADKRWTFSDDNIYAKIGFKKEVSSYPDYHYVRQDKCERLHKFNFRKQKLSKKYGFPLTMTEREMTKELGYERIWDCGLIRYVYNNPGYLL